MVGENNWNLTTKLDIGTVSFRTKKSTQVVKLNESQLKRAQNREVDIDFLPSMGTKSILGVSTNSEIERYIFFYHLEFLIQIKFKCVINNRVKYNNNNSFNEFT